MIVLCFPHDGASALAEFTIVANAFSSSGFGCIIDLKVLITRSDQARADLERHRGMVPPFRKIASSQAIGRFVSSLTSDIFYKIVSG